MAKDTRSKHTGFWTIGAFLIGTLFGSGSIWQWKQQQLDKVMKTTELRKQENDLYAKIIELSADYAKDMDRLTRIPPIYKQTTTCID